MHTIKSKIAAASLIAAVAVGGYTAGTIDARSEPTSLTETVCAPAPAKLAIIGDSLTSWNPPYGGNLAQSWVPAATSTALPVVAGYARPGATLAEMEANLKYAEVDAFIMMVGTNDLAIPYKRKAGTPVEKRFAAMDRMAAKMNAPVTVVLAVAPFGWTYSVGNTWNAELKAYAEQRGFVFIDPWTSAKDARGWWRAGAHRDGVHPTPAIAAAAGAVVRDTLEELQTSP